MTHGSDSGQRNGAARAAAFAAVLCLALLLGYGLWTRQGSRVVFRGDSAFGQVRVVERADGLRSLYVGAGRARQSAVFPGRPEHLEIAYTRVAMVGLALAPPDARILFVGLGGGAMPAYTRRALPHARIDVVEIDPLIVEVAGRFFGFRPDDAMVVHTGDGRAFIERAAPGSYHLVVLDAFSDDQIPRALATVEFLEAVRATLVPGGVVVSNLWSSSGEYGPMLSTYDAVFPELHLIRVGSGLQRIVVAAPEVRRLDRAALVAASRRLGERVDLEFDLADLVRRGYQPAPPPNSPMLRDAFP
jgi:spermidine synthase